MTDRRNWPKTSGGGAGIGNDAGAFTPSPEPRHQIAGISDRLYVLRAYEGAPVATPLDWSEVRRGLSPKQFHLGNAVERFERTGDLFRGVLDRPQRLEPAIERLSKLMRND